MSKTPHTETVDPSFVTAARGRQRSAFLLAASVILVLFGFVFIMAFRPLWLAPSSARDGASSLGMWCGLLLILANCAVMGGYVLWRGSSESERGQGDR